ncbi:MAG: sigma-70 family RNA polymerase sigma factor [Bacilli bacterium]|nr:sigma-70 family RNA polymerase sigma factor [Bacilli bacterium]
MESKKISDDELIAGILNNSFSAEFTLINRYRGFSYILAKELLSDCNYSSLIDMDDLISIGLADVFVAIKTYTATGRFKVYWRRIAKNDMVSHIRNIITHFGMFTNILDDNRVTSFSSDDNDHSSDVYDQVLEFLNNPINNIKKSDKEMFLMYVDGFEFEEIAKEFNVSYHWCNRRIVLIRKKLINYLNSIK